MFTWILQVLATADLLKGTTIGIDATILEANAALRSIVRRDSGYQEFLMRLAQASGKLTIPLQKDCAPYPCFRVVSVKAIGAVRVGSIRLTDPEVIPQ